MNALDLFCGAGGASMGISDCGFKVTGIDNRPQKYYPFEFIQQDVMKLDQEFLSLFDFIWASPPCQLYSIGTIGARMEGKQYPHYVSVIRDLLLKTGKPFVIENVMPAPLRRDLILCGEMFNLPIHRHRVFEIHGFKVRQPEHKKHERSVCKGTAIGVWSGGKPGCFGNRDKYLNNNWKAPTLNQYQEAMQMHWVKSKKPIEQAIPPVYSNYIVSHLLEKKLVMQCLTKEKEGISK